MKTPYQATKTRSNRPGWSVTFKHPKRSDSRGKPGLKIRKGLGTQDEIEADRLVAQLNTLLSDERWWSTDRRAEAEQQLDQVVISAFFDGMEAGKHNSLALRESKIPLPAKEEGYSRILFTGTTGAGKTTLLRHIIGSKHKEDRFPSTSTARTTTAEIEIITSDEPFKAAITFMPEHEVRAHIDECIEEACLRVLENKSDEKIMDGLLAHREQRFRLSYTLGSWKQNAAEPSNDDFSFDNDPEKDDELPEGEAATQEQIKANQDQLLHFLNRIKKISSSAKTQTEHELGEALKDQKPNDRSVWIEIFIETLYEQEQFSKLSFDIMDEVQDRFSHIESGQFEYSSTGWPLLWAIESADRTAFLSQIRWFSSNHYSQFGRLLTPLVDGVRAKGPFFPQPEDLKIAPRLVLLDGEGVGHSAKSTSSISTRITSRFSEANLILLVDNAEQPMQKAPLELLRSIGSSGNAGKLSICFTHFDLVKGPNLRTQDHKREHVLSSVRDAIGSIRDSIGTPVAAALEKRAEHLSFYLGGLDREIEKIPDGYQKEIRTLLETMQEPVAPVKNIDLEPIYSGEGLEIALSDAIKGFREPWQARLGFMYLSDFPKEHWSRVKALTRRLALGWNNNEYEDLRPVADLVARLQESISRWLDNPADWNRLPHHDEERNAALDPIRNAVFKALHNLSEERIAELHRADWTIAYDHSGNGSSYKRADGIKSIYDKAAPIISSSMSNPAREFLTALHQLVRQAIEDAGGQFGIMSNR